MGEGFLETRRAPVGTAYCTRGTSADLRSGLNLEVPGLMSQARGRGDEGEGEERMLGLKAVV